MLRECLFMNPLPTTRKLPVRDTNSKMVTEEAEEEDVVRVTAGSLWRHITCLNHKQFPKEEQRLSNHLAASCENHVIGQFSASTDSCFHLLLFIDAFQSLCFH